MEVPLSSMVLRVLFAQRERRGLLLLIVFLYSAVLRSPADSLLSHVIPHE